MMPTGTPVTVHAEAIKGDEYLGAMSAAQNTTREHTPSHFLDRPARRSWVHTIAVTGTLLAYTART